MCEENEFDIAPLTFSGNYVFLKVLKAIVKVTGLSVHEELDIRRTWDRCLWSVTDFTGPDKEVNYFEVNRDEHSGWVQFQEDLVVVLTKIAIESCRGEYFMFHAAGIAHTSTGNSVALVAPSGTGKTTAARILCSKFGLISDETVATLPDGTLLPYPKPLSILNSTGMRPKDQFSPTELELLPAPEFTSLGKIFILDRDRTGILEDAVTEKLSLIASLERIAPESSSLGIMERGLSSLCELIESVGGIHLLRYSEAEQLVPFISAVLETLDRPENRSLPGQRTWDLVATFVAEENAPMPGMYRRVVVEDAIILDEKLVLLADEQLTILGGLGPVLWDLLAEWKTTEDLILGLTREFGPHPEARSIVADTLSDFSRRGLIEMSSSKLE